MSGINKLLDRLRDVGNLHEFAELFDFSWHDDTDWTWHDVAVRMADEIEAELCGSVDRSRWHELFGTPERAARTIREIRCASAACEGCPFYEACGHGKAELLEWLKGGAE